MIPQIRQFDISDTGDGQVAANYWVLRLHTNNSKNKKMEIKKFGMAFIVWASPGLRENGGFDMSY